MRNYILIIVLFLSCGSIYSQNYLNVVKTDNSVQSFDILSTEIHFSTIGDLIVKQGADADIQFLFSNVKELRFSNELTTIYPDVKKENISIFQKENNLYLKGLDDTELVNISVFNTMGQILFSKNQAYSEPINTTSLHSGIYILKINNNQSFKLIKK